MKHPFRGVSLGIALSGGILLAGMGLRSQPLLAFPQKILTRVTHATLLTQATKGQRLPITATAVMRGKRIELEVAKTFEQQAIGLMFRTELSPHRGMLFPFDPARTVAFWMKDTLIPLDMVFLYQGKIQAIVPNVPPCKQIACPSYGPTLLVDQVIELKSGRAAELGLKAGDLVPVQELPAANVTPKPRAKSA